MKKYVNLALITIICISIILTIPQLIKLSILNVSTTNKETISYNEFVHASGVIEQKYKNDIFFDIPIVAKNINVKIGERIEKGDVIATVDKEATQQAILDLVSNNAEFIPEQVISVFSNHIFSIESIKNNITSEIIATSDGIITSLPISQGIMIPPKEIIATISDTKNLQAKLSVNEKNISKIEEGQKVILTTEAFKEKEYIGYVSTIFPTARKKLNGTTQETVIDILVELENNYEEIKPGFSTDGKIFLEQEKKIDIIPYDAVLQDEDKTEYVYIYKHSKAIRKNIITGIETEKGIEVIEGLNSNDKIITNPYNIQNDNSFVKLK